MGAVTTELQRRREAAGFTFAELSKRSGVPAELIEAAEAGSPLNVHAQGRLAAALGEVPSDLFPRRWAGSEREAATVDG